MGFLDRNGSMPQIVPRPTQFQQGVSFSVPAPYAGLDLREDITALQPNQARVLDNFYSSGGSVSIRPGFSSFGTGMGSGEVKTLAPYVGPSTTKLIAGANGKLFDSTSAGAATQLATGFTQDRWQFQCFSGKLLFCNGTDTPQTYDGSSVAGSGWTGSGLTVTNLINVALVRNRIWYCEKNSADVWYGGVASITGTLTKFQLSQITSGGYCMAIGSWSTDAGDGQDDFTAFVMSTGEILIYQGDVSTTFTMIGRFQGAPPIGRRCLFRVGGELIVITRLGLLPVSAAVANVALDLSRVDPWGKIASGIVTDVGLYSGNDGWQGVLHEGTVYLTIPQSSGALSKQYVLNTRLGTWSTYSSWNASCLASFNGSLYFGAETGGIVNLVGAATDSGSMITAKSNGAFSLPSGPSRSNLFTAVRPKIQADGAVSGLIGVDTDYVIRSLVGDSVSLLPDTSTTPWGSPWGSPWGTPNQSQPQWFSIVGNGRAVSIRMQVTSNSQNFEWYATDVLCKQGGTK